MQGVGRPADLAVSDLRVAVGIRSEQTPQCGDARVVLEGRVVGQRSMQVALDLLCGQAAHAHGGLQQACILVLVGRQFRRSTCPRGVENRHVSRSLRVLEDGLSEETVIRVM